jgi:hypothetical protein
MKKKIYSPKTASTEYFQGQISEWTIRMWLRDRRLEKMKVGSRTFITEEELDKFVRANNPRKHSARATRGKAA